MTEPDGLIERAELNEVGGPADLSPEIIQAALKRCADMEPLNRRPVRIIHPFQYDAYKEIVEKFGLPTIQKYGNGFAEAEMMVVTNDEAREIYKKHYAAHFGRKWDDDEP